MSCLVLSCLVLSCLVLSCLVLSYRIVSYRILSYLILSYLILSCLVLSYLILSYLILSYLIFLSSYLCKQTGCASILAPGRVSHGHRRADHSPRGCGVHPVAGVSQEFQGLKLMLSNSGFLDASPVISYASAQPLLSVPSANRKTAFTPKSTVWPRLQRKSWHPPGSLSASCGSAKTAPLMVSRPWRNHKHAQG